MSLRLTPVMGDEKYQIHHKVLLSKFRSEFRYCSSFLFNDTQVKVKVEVTQSCPTLFDPMGYLIHGILLSQDTGVGSLFLLQEVFPTQGLNPGLPHCRRILFFFFLYKSEIFIFIVPTISNKAYCV